MDVPELDPGSCVGYPVKADGSLGEGEKWIEGEGFGDGIKVDVKGNLFSSSGAGKRPHPHHRAERQDARLAQHAGVRRRTETADLRNQQRALVGRMARRSSSPVVMRSTPSR